MDSAFMHIVTATLADVPALSILLSELFSQEAEFTPNDEAQRRGLARIIADPGIGVILVAKDGEGVLGIANVLFTISTALGEPVAILEDVIVAAPARGAGVGGQLLDHAIAVARDRGCKRMTLLTDRTNEAAQRFYGRHGFAASPMIPLRLALT
jgi:GNAT superfamily N-acetyltransferase